MFCQTCGDQVSDTARFCQSCGCQIIRQVQNKLPASTKSNMGFGKALLYFIALTVGVVVVVLVLLDMNRSSTSFTTSVQNVASELSAKAAGNQVGVKKLLGQSLEVEPLMYRYYQINVDSTWKRARLVGDFRAAGGQGNDIEVYVRAEPTGGQTWYASGRTTTGMIDVPLPSGTYYLVFSNSYSLLSTKTIMGHIELQYEY